MTDDDIKRDREVIAAATPGPWTSVRCHGQLFGDGTPVSVVCSAPNQIVAYDVGEPEADFIAAARTRWPAAIDALEAARRELDALRKENRLLRGALPDEDDIASAIADWLDGIRFTKPGREAEWTRHLAAQIREGRWRGR